MKQYLTVEDARELLSLIPVPQPGTNSRIYWIKVISAACSAVGEENALPLLKEWQEPWERNAYETVIRSFHGSYKSSAGTLFYLAGKKRSNGGVWNG